MFVSLSRALHLCRLHRIDPAEFLAAFGTSNRYHADAIAEWIGVLP